MNDTQRQQIKELRGKGYGYGRIAQILSLSENTIKTFSTVYLLLSLRNK